MDMIYLPVIVFNFGVFARVGDLPSLGLLVEHEGVECDASAEQRSRIQAHLLHLHHLELRVHRGAEVLCAGLSGPEAIEIATAALEGLIGSMARPESPVHVDSQQLVIVYIFNTGRIFHLPTKLAMGFSD